MIRLYLSNHSYPELREMTSRWRRHLTWWRAFGSAFGDRRFWLFAAAQFGLLLAGISVTSLMIRLLHLDGIGAGWLGTGVLFVMLLAWSALALSWGGDLMRPHLRRVSPPARSSCPCCGYLLTAQLHQASPGEHDRGVRCPECAFKSPPETFSPPYPIPRACRAIRFRRDASHAGPQK